jgi:hypothetical protein
VPFDGSASSVDIPSADTSDSDPSTLRIAIDPDDAIGPDGRAEPLGSVLSGDDGPAVALEAGLPVGGGPPHATTVISATQPRSGTRVID